MEPTQLAVGSVIEGPRGRFVWHCHAADDRAGSTRDYGAADSQFKEAVEDGFVMVAV